METGDAAHGDQVRVSAQRAEEGQAFKGAKQAGREKKCIRI